MIKRTLIPTIITLSITTTNVSQAPQSEMFKEKYSLEYTQAIHEYKEKYIEQQRLMEEQQRIIEEENRKREEFNNKKSYILSNNKNVSEQEAELIINTINKELTKYPDLSLNVILAQVKQESNFNKNLVSGCQDTGLFQILPSTGEEIAQELNMNYNYNMLFNIETNIEMGIYYLNKQIQLAKNYTTNEDNQLKLALVAYNAGPRAYYDFKNKGVLRNQYYNHVLRHLEYIV